MENPTKNFQKDCRNNEMVKGAEQLEETADNINIEIILDNSLFTELPEEANISELVYCSIS